MREFWVWSGFDDKIWSPTGRHPLLDFQLKSLSVNKKFTHLSRTYLPIKSYRESCHFQIILFRLLDSLGNSPSSGVVVERWRGRVERLTPLGNLELGWVYQLSWVLGTKSFRANIESSRLSYAWQKSWWESARRLWSKFIIIILDWSHMQEKQFRFPDDFGSREPSILQDTDVKKSFQQDYWWIWLKSGARCIFPLATVGLMYLNLFDFFLLKNLYPSVQVSRGLLT